MISSIELVLGWSFDPGPTQSAGRLPAIFYHGVYMSYLSVFVDESGDFGDYQPHSPYYIVSMVLHDQAQRIDAMVKKLDQELWSIKK